ncbi:serine/arginine repetitive matrix protein 1-like [Scomber scombrus]|uniref:Serine/arginine repetitive matrix protein 1-like n=1 Tax=Scomber scombrus TaxID=13677 RepID=A0AAV1N7G3_SCOSC
MDFISLSPSDDEIFGDTPHTQRQGLQPSEEAAISPVLSVPETSPSLPLHQPRKRPVPAGSVSSMVTIPPGSSLLNLQNYSSSDDSSTSSGSVPLLRLPAMAYPNTIQIMGRWASLTYHRYICSDLNDLRSAQARLK